jgi:hypothetical protein
MKGRVNISIVKSALQELSDIDYQWRVWVKAGESEMSSMDEAAAALFDDSGLDLLFQKYTSIFSIEIDAKLHKLRKLLESSLERQRKKGIAEEINSERWGKVRALASEILELIHSQKDLTKR